MSKTLFHFTTQFDKLVAILKDRLYGSYCKEKIFYKNDNEIFPVPMICFCNIAVHEISSQKYGKNGIGLKVGWGVRNQLNPVLYIEKKSLLAQSYLKSIDCFYIHYNNLCLIDEKLRVADEFRKPNNSVVKNKAIVEAIDKLQNERRELEESVNFTLYTAFYVKYYKDDLILETETKKDYTFYNEREWRFVPKLNSDFKKYLEDLKNYEQWRKSETYKKIIPTISLSFDYDDIDYIVVESKIRINELKNILNELFDNKRLIGDRDFLFSKIICYEDYM